MKKRYCPALAVSGALLLAACGGGGSGGGGTASGPDAAVASCKTCHALGPNGPRSAPTLVGVVGRKAGTVPGFNYSAAMKNSGITWTAGEIDAFLAAPQKVVPGNRMVSPPVADAAQRKAIVDYLATLK